MTNKVLRLLFQFLSEYKGSPLYITGNALRHAISRQINSSFGCFTNQKRLHSPVNNNDKNNEYNNYFGIREEKPFLLPHTQHFFSRTQNKGKAIIYFTPSAVTFDIIDAPEDLVNHIEKQEIIQFGGLRNEGFGIVKLIDHIEINLNDIELPTEATHITLLSPILHLPKFVESYDCRHEHLLLWNNGKRNRIKIISAGQFFRLKNDKLVEKIALKGILRKCLFGQFGFGEYILNNWPKEEQK